MPDIVNIMSEFTNTLKVRIKTGGDEFEAEGPVDAVRAQVATFVRLLGRAGDMEENAQTSSASADPQPQSGPDIHNAFHVDGKVVSVASQSSSVDQDLLAILWGQHQLRRVTGISGTEIMSGLRASGHQVIRTDHVLKRYISSGDIVVTGKYRSRRYRLTTDGAAKALNVARAIAAAASPKSE
jgi:hypothetical protein